MPDMTLADFCAHADLAVEGGTIVLTADAAKAIAAKIRRRDGETCATCKHAKMGMFYKVCIFLSNAVEDDVSCAHMKFCGRWLKREGE